MEVKQTSYSWEWAASCLEEELIREIRNNYTSVINQLTESVPKRSENTTKLAYKILECLWITLDDKKIPEVRKFFTFIRENCILEATESSLIKKITFLWQAAYSKDAALTDLYSKIVKKNLGFFYEDVFLSEIVQCIDDFQMTLSLKKTIKFSLIEQLRNTTQSKWKYSPRKFPLHSAVELGLSSTLNLLLNRCQLADQIDSKGNTPLHLACRSRWGSTPHSLGILRELMNHVTDVNAQNFHGQTYLHELCQNQNEYIEIATTLLERGVDPLAKTQAGVTALEIAFDKGSYGIVRLILKNLLLKTSNCLAEECENFKKHSGITFDKILNTICNRVQIDSNYHYFFPAPSIEAWHKVDNQFADIAIALIKLGATPSQQNRLFILCLIPSLNLTDFERIFVVSDQLGMTCLHHRDCLKEIDYFKFPIDLSTLKNCDGISPNDLKNWSLSSNLLKIFQDAEKGLNHFSRDAKANGFQEKIKSRLEKLDTIIIIQGKEISSLVTIDQFKYDLKEIRILIEELLSEKCQYRFQYVIHKFFDNIVDWILLAHMNAQVGKLHSDQIPIPLNYKGCLPIEVHVNVAIATALMLNFKRHISLKSSLFELIAHLLTSSSKKSSASTISCLKQEFDFGDFYRDLGLVLPQNIAINWLQWKIPHEIEELKKDRFKTLVRVMQFSNVILNSKISK